MLDSGTQIDASSERGIEILGIGGKSHTSSARNNVQLKSKPADFSSRHEAMVFSH